MCWEKCAGSNDVNCHGKCIDMNTELSAPCSKCQGATIQCAYDNCYKECEADLNTDKCETCVQNAGCLDTDCFGEQPTP